MHCLRNNLSFLVSGASWLVVSAKTLSKKYIAGFAAGYYVVAFL